VLCEPKTAMMLYANPMSWSPHLRIKTGSSLLCKGQLGRQSDPLIMRHARERLVLGDDLNNIPAWGHLARDSSNGIERSHLDKVRRVGGCCLDRVNEEDETLRRSSFIVS
jgi:hypothetical protein